MEKIRKYYDHIIFILFVSIMVLSSIYVSVCSAETLKGFVIKVSDGDTVNIINNEDGQKYRIRLACIDAPESKQEFGLESRNALADMIYNKEVSVNVINTDMYGRKVGLIEYQGIDINAYMLYNGYAWHYRQYNKTSKKEEYDILERDAQENKRGLWNSFYPIEPWVWRKTKR